jgi:antirestriction protein ArdC
MNAVKEQQQPSDARVNVKSQVAQMLIDAMERGDTPWQRPWDAQRGSPMSAMNPTTGNAYKGVNRILLAIAGAGFGSNHWMTYQQAASKGWNVRKGKKGSMIVKVVELGRSGDRGEGAVRPDGASSGDAGGQESDKERSAGHALKRYWVFNAEQIEGMPPSEPKHVQEFQPVEKAEAIMEALKERTGLLVIHGGNKACYVPALDEIRLPPKQSFHSVYDRWATELHEAAHSTMHEKRLDRSEAYAKRWGDSAYALEELTAEIASAILASETGVPMSQDPKHVQAHGSYLRSWIKAIENDPMAIFTAAKNADRICEYMLGLERQHTALAPHKEWIAEYDIARAA